MYSLIYQYFHLCWLLLFHILQSIVIIIIIIIDIKKIVPAKCVRWLRVLYAIKYTNMRINSVPEMSEKVAEENVMTPRGDYIMMETLTIDGVTAY